LKDKSAKKRVCFPPPYWLALDYSLISLQDRLEDKEAVETKRRKESPDGPKEVEPKVLSPHSVLV